MKRFLKRTVSVGLASFMALMPCLPVFAENVNPVAVGEEDVTVKKNSITVDGAVAGHSYKVYQIFTGTAGEAVNEDGSSRVTVGNAKYGANYVPEGKNTGDAVPASELNDITDAKEFAKKIKDKLTGEPITILTKDNNFTEIDGGYYLVMDEAGKEDGDAASDFIVAVAGNAVFKPKSVSVPGFDKRFGGNTNDNIMEYEIMASDISLGHKYELYQIYTGEPTENKNALKNIEYGFNYGIPGDKVPDNIGYPNDLDDVKEEIVNNVINKPITTLSEDNLSAKLAAGYYLVNDIELPNNISDSKIIFVANNVDISEEMKTFNEPIDWNYTIDEENKIITLNYYTGSEENVVVYANYVLDNIKYKTRLKSNMDMVWSKYMFAGCKNIVSVKFENNLYTGDMVGMANMFSNCSKLKTVSFGKNFDTGNVTTMANMFARCSSLPEIDVTGFNTKKVIDMGGMFRNCTTLSKIDVTNFDTSNVINMGGPYNSGMFSNCTALSEIDVTNFDTGHVTNMQNMFSGCTSITSIDVNNFNTSNVTNMYGMFNECSSLAALNLSSFDTSNVEDMGYMFTGDSLLQTINLSSFNTSNVTNMRAMFSRCTSLEMLNLSTFNTYNVIDMNSMFSDSNKLTSIIVNQNTWSTSQANTTGIFVNCGTDCVTYVSDCVTYVSNVSNVGNTKLISMTMADETAITSSDSDTSAEYGIGDKVPFVLEASMPESISAYDTYKLEFKDTMGSGLSLDITSIEVYAGDQKTSGENYTVTTNGQDMAVEIADAKAAPFNASAGSTITVKYTATLTDAAAFKNVNKAYLKYSNDPKSDSMGKTVSDEVTAFTFTLSFDKTDGDGNALPGAGFTLYKKGRDGEYAPVKDEVKDAASFSFKGLSAGEYKLVESTTPGGYNTMEDLMFKIIASVGEDTEGTASVTNLKMAGADGNGINGWEADMSSGIISSSIINYTGATLPSTGGIGTAVFYVAGGMLVLTAGVVAVAKKKAKEDE